MSTKVDRNYTNVRNMRKSFESEEIFCPMAPHGKANSEQFEIIKLEMFKTVAPMAPRKGGWGRNSWMSIPICFLFSNNKSLVAVFSFLFEPKMSQIYICNVVKLPCTIPESHRSRPVSNGAWRIKSQDLTQSGFLSIFVHLKLSLCADAFTNAFPLLRIY